MKFEIRKEKLNLEKKLWLKEYDSEIESAIAYYQEYEEFWRKFDKGEQLLDLSRIKFGAKKYEKWKNVIGDLLQLEFKFNTHLNHACALAYKSSGSAIFRFNDVIIYKEFVAGFGDKYIKESIGNMIYQHDKKSSCIATYGEVFRNLEELIYLKRIEKNKIYRSKLYDNADFTKEEQIVMDKLLKSLSLNDYFYNLIENEYLNSVDMDELQAILHVLSIDNALCCRQYRKTPVKEASFVKRQAIIFDYYRKQYTLADETQNFDNMEFHRKQRIYL